MRHALNLKLALTLSLLLGAGAALAQSPKRDVPSVPSAKTDDYKDRVVGALDVAKKAAEDLQKRHQSLLTSLKEASDGQRATAILNDLISSAESVGQKFGEQSDVLKAIGDVMAFIDTKRKDAESRIGEGPRWQGMVEEWKRSAGHFRNLRQELLKNVDLTASRLEELKKDRVFIEHVIALKGIDGARKELEAAVDQVKRLGDALGSAVETARKNVVLPTGPGG